MLSGGRGLGDEDFTRATDRSARRDRDAPEIGQCRRRPSILHEVGRGALQQPTATAGGPVEGRLTGRHLDEGAGGVDDPLGFRGECDQIAEGARAIREHVATTHEVGGGTGGEAVDEMRGAAPPGDAAQECPAGTDLGRDEAPLLNAKYRFEQALRASGVPWVVFRSGGFFPDLAEMKKLAAKGPLYAIGKGDSRSSPIHVPDLAAILLDEMSKQTNAQIDIGGPQDLTWRETCALCFETQGLPVRIQSAPIWLCKGILAVLRPFSYRYYAMGRLLLFMSTHDVCTPHRGTLTLRDFLSRP